LRHPCKFQRVFRLGSVTARHSSGGRQPNFAALNRGRHLYSAGRPSRWALAHILVFCLFVSESISLEPLNGSAPNSYGRRDWFLAQTSLNVKDNSRAVHYLHPKSRVGCRLLCPFPWVGGSPSYTMSPGPRPTSVPSGILIHPTVWPQYINAIDRQDRRDIGPVS